MDNLIERYVQEVTRRLPEKEREEVSRELKSNIYDMLPEHPDEAAIKNVLNGLGSPAALAEKYRQNPRHLISPAYYDEYTRALKWVLPLVGVVVMAIGMLVGAIEAMKGDAASVQDIAYIISNIISKGVSMGVSAAFQALVWTTVGFVIAEHAGEKVKGTKAPVWKVEDLPELQPNEKTRIPLSDGIAELILTVVFSIIGILFCVGSFPFAMIIIDGQMQVANIFSAEFLAALVPVIAVTAAFGVASAVVKIKDCHWTSLVCSLHVLHKLVSMALSVYMLTRPFIFSAEFTAFMKGFNMPELAGFPWFGVNGMNPFLVFIAVMTVIGTIADCAKSIALTVKYKK
ncbi:MAG: hypothetical protein ABFC31_14370 [Clostridiaceae bacterium]